MGNSGKGCALCSYTLMGDSLGIYMANAGTTMRKYLLVALLLISAAALIIPDFTLSTRVLNQTVNAGESVNAEILIVNNEPIPGDYVLVISGPFPSWISYYEYVGTVPASGRKIVPVTITPTAGGSYDYTVELKSQGITLKQSSIRFTAVGEPPQSIPISLNITLPETIIPGEDIAVKVDITGFVPDEAEVVLMRNNIEVYRVLASIERAEKIIRFQLPDVMLAGEYTITVRTGQTRDSKKFTIAEIKKVEESKSMDNTLFGRSISLKVKNKGTVFAEGTIRDTLMWYERGFTKFSEKPDIQGSEVLWKYGLLPNQEFEVEYTVSFIPLVLAIIIIIMVLAYIAQESGELLLEKTGSYSEGSINVKLKVENVSKDQIKKIAISDIIPPFTKAKYSEPPKNKLNTNDGLLVSWTLPELKPGESKTIQYSLIFIETIGRLHLPKASVEYTAKDGKSKTNSSLSPYIFGE